MAVIQYNLYHGLYLTWFRLFKPTSVLKITYRDYSLVGRLSRVQNAAQCTLVESMQAYNLYNMNLKVTEVIELQARLVLISQDHLAVNDLYDL